jgi:hypothetical protein
MQLPTLNYLAVLVAAIVLFVLGGLWYSPAMFAKRWMALQGRSMEEMKAGNHLPMPVMLLISFVCGLLVALALAVLLHHYSHMDAMKGAGIGALCWLGFQASTSFTTSLFSSRPTRLWLIDAGYNLVSVILAGAILGGWR